MPDVLWPSVVTALLAKITATVPSTVPVFDGLPVTYESLTSYVIVAGDTSGEGQAGTWDGVITTIGMPYRVQENGSVVCSVVSQTGDPTAATTRSAATALLESINDAVDAEPDLGLGASTIVSGRVSGGTVLTGQTSQGSSTEIQFTYAYEGVTGP